MSGKSEKRVLTSIDELYPSTGAPSELRKAWLKREAEKSRPATSPSSMKSSGRESLSDVINRNLSEENFAANWERAVYGSPEEED